MIRIPLFWSKTSISRSNGNLGGKELLLDQVNIEHKIANLLGRLKELISQSVPGCLLCQLVNLCGLRNTQQSLELIHSIWVIEINVLVEPLDGKVFLVRVKECFVDGLQVLHSSHRGDEGVGRFFDWVVGLHDAEWEPSLFALRVQSVGDL